MTEQYATAKLGPYVAVISFRNAALAGFRRPSTSAWVQHGPAEVPELGLTVRRGHPTRCVNYPQRNAT